MKKYKIVILLLIILAVAAFFRLWQLDSIPPGLYPDEAINGNDALKALETNQFKVFYPDNNGREGLYINLIAFSFSVFDHYPWSLRLVTAILGILTVLGLYLLVKEILNKNIALLASFLLAVSFWHVNFSRIGFRAILVPFCLVFSFYFLFKGLKNNKFWNFILSGIFFGLGFYTYIAFRIAPLIVALIFIISLILTKEKKKLTGLLAVWLLVVFLVGLPIGLYFLDNPADFMGRAGGVSIFAQPNPLKSLSEGLAKSLAMFNFIGDGNWRHNFSGQPQLLLPVGILFILGLILSIKDFFKSLKERKQFIFIVHCLLLSWFVIMLSPAFLSAEGLPHALRAIGVIPVVYIFAGLGLWWLVEKSKLNLKLKQRKAVSTVLILFLLAVGYIQFDKYFIDWARQPDVEGAFNKNYVEIGNYLNSLDKEIRRYVIVNESGVLVDGLPMPAQTVKFITAERSQNQYLLPQQIAEIEPNKPSIIIPLRYDQQLFNQLKEKFKEGEIKEKNGFWTYELL